MDNQLKERLVGATVLVVLAVIFIPMLLDGPDSRQRIQQKVDLPPAGDQQTDRQTVRIDLRDSSAQPEVENSETPVSAASEELAEVDLTQAGAPATIRDDGGARAGQPDSSTGTENAEAAEENDSTGENDGTGESNETPASATAKVVTPEPARPEGAWTVQVGSFGNAANADALAERLSKLGYEAFVSRYDDGSRIHFRVRVGGYVSRDAAAAKAEDVKRRTGEPARPAKND